ncbi:GNAT family N-acetyltransferase [Vibrio coralliirubri]|uniref:GNAT family N-acetyltransferase n=1 Tax=Vibrio coralliirubri TaxID=1516159 RepID=UPI0022840379|nr:GNAT family N-acetyltransferase [Vibrio coralliirubri]MCY9861357.1 GNAT family N-acetyltransferase [Vibrio coralliirubri]
MLDAWCEAACDAVSKLGVDPSENEGFDLANMVLFSIMKCDLYLGIFDGYYLEHGIVGQSRICVPNKNTDKQNHYITAHPANAKEFRRCAKSTSALMTPLIQRAINYLPVSILIKMAAPPHPVVNLRVITHSPLIAKPSQQLANFSEMSYGDFEHLTELFGHIYLSNSNNEDFVVAENLAGVIGVVSLFRHEVDGLLVGLSISGISVTPCYRKMGIATALCLAAATHAKTLGIPLSITAPTQMGKGTIYRKLKTDVCYQDKLIFEPFFYLFAPVFSELEIEYDEKVELLNWFNQFVTNEYDIDYSDKYFNDRETLTELRRELKQRALYIRLKNL